MSLRPKPSVVPAPGVVRSSDVRASGDPLRAGTRPPAVVPPAAGGSAYRRPEFDGLRVVALLLLMGFHSLSGFGSWPWHVTDPHDAPAVDDVLDFTLRWRVLLVFIVSGAALMLALGRRGVTAILCERLKRLGVPLLFGIVVIVPPQIYLERRQRGQFDGSYIDFLPRLFDGLYPVGNLGWHHLWFMPYVLVLTAVALPLFRQLALTRRFDGFSHIAARYHLYWLLLLPIVAANVVLGGVCDDHVFLGDARGWIEFATLFGLGGLLARWPVLLSAVQRGVGLSFLAGVIAYATLRVTCPASDEAPSLVWAAAAAVDGFAWALVVTAIVTYFIDRTSRALAYLTDAALPVYMLHQTLVVYAVFELHQVAWPLPVKIAVTFSFALVGSLALYEGLIRRNRWLGFLFGVKPRARRSGPDVLLAGRSTATSRWSVRSS